jgi:hypothetical protein
MFICFVSCQGNFANIVTSKLPQLTVLAVGHIFKLSRMQKFSSQVDFLKVQVNGTELVFDLFYKNIKIQVKDRIWFILLSLYLDVLISKSCYSLNILLRLSEMGAINSIQVTKYYLHATSMGWPIVDRSFTVFFIISISSRTNS